MKLYFWYVHSLFSDALVVTDKTGTVYYLSLGKWAVLVDKLRRDFIRARREVMPGKEETKNAQVGEALHQISRLLESPQLFDSIAPSIKTSYIFGTDLQRQIWEELKTIPTGAISTYKQVATNIGRPGQARVVGGACSANRIALLVPCHRVTGTKSELTGYRYGLPLKQELLSREAAPS